MSQTELSALDQDVAAAARDLKWPKTRKSIPITTRFDTSATARQ